MKIRLNNSADATAVVSIANKFKSCDIDVLSFELPKTIEVTVQSDNQAVIKDLEHQLGFWRVEE